MEVTKSVSTAMSVLLSPPVYYFIIALVIIKILLLKYIPTHILMIYRNIFYRIGFAFLVAIIAAYDYILATILVAVFVLATKELNNRDIIDQSTNNVQPIPNSFINSMLAVLGGNNTDIVLPDVITATSKTLFPASALASSASASSTASNALASNALASNALASSAAASAASNALASNAASSAASNALASTSNVNYLLQQTQTVDLVNQVNANIDQSNIVPDTNYVDAVIKGHPSSATLTDNLISKGFENLTLDQLNMSSSNLITGVDPDKMVESSISTATSANSTVLTTGLNLPIGYDSRASMTSKY